MSVQEVVLVNEADEAIGTMEKMEAHRKAVLHRAFSVFIFNSKGDMLLQQRADNKYHSAGLWTNACCSHPAPGEDIAVAAERRLKEELGFSAKLKPAFKFTYKSVYSNGLTEHEYDHVFVGIYDGAVPFNVDEVKDYSFMNTQDLARLIELRPERFTSWFIIAFPKMKAWIESNNLD